MDLPETITIIGTGLLGTSLGLAIKRHGYRGRIIGIGHRLETAERARAMGAVDDATTDYAEAIPNSGLAIIAVPLGQFDGVFERIAGFDHDKLSITDVGSAKQLVQASAERWLANPRRFIGAHPMAGRELSGPEAAKADLFDGRVCIICRQPADADPDTMDDVETLFGTLCDVCIYMTPEEHDRNVAACSHLPHLVAALLVHATLGLTSDDPATASTGFRDATRLASSNPPMRLDIIRANRSAITEALSAYRDELDQLIERLDHGNDDALLTWLQGAKAWRDEWITKQFPPESGP